MSVIRIDKNLIQLISAMNFLLQTKTQPLEHIGTSELACASETMYQLRNFRIGPF